ncbi:NADPH-dependent FMN reductase [Pelagibacterium lentulum]|uniref:FMN reductase n=1 Tax=Pelagibacterium lentulum TaxID=2029865 RepID=A0A916R719_9HYPH|nr:NADPH-dependent FMN reductase [Pelagibacterium lentulum]GGA37641.1 FMN reductase [Pelagibacterium lentulum]
MLKALTLSGSIRKGSENVKLQREVGARLEAAGVSVNAISLSDYDMPIFNEDLEPDHVPKAAEKLAELLRSHDIVFIATPEYNGGLPPLLVNAIAWLSRQKPFPFRNAVFGIGGVSSGKYGTIWAQSHLRDSLSKIGTLVVPTLLGLGPASEVFDSEDKLIDEGAGKKIDQMINQLTHFSRGGI